MSESVLRLRTKLMSTRKVICTGNPERPGTLAQGFKKLFPDAIFLCRSTGWDLSDSDQKNLQKIRKVFQGSNTFLNCSYIGPGVQEKLLDLCHDALKFCDVVNIGSTHEYDGLGRDEYRDSKINLRNKSLMLDSFRFSTCHLILGGIKKNDCLAQQTWLDVDMICDTVNWIWRQPFHISIMSMDQPKMAW